MVYLSPAFPPPSVLVFHLMAAVGHKGRFVGSDVPL